MIPTTGTSFLYDPQALSFRYQAVAYIEASAVIYQDGKILIEVDNLQAASSPYLQIKGSNKEVVLAAASILKLDSTYTTKSYLQIILESLPAFERNTNGIHNQQAARLQELVEFILSQGGSLSSEYSADGKTLSTDVVIEDIQYRLKKLERWHAINMVLWTILVSALVGYSLFKRKRH